MKVIDSHTEGEPTRVVVSGGPALGSGSLKERLAQLESHHDHFRQSVILEPRGSDVLVGALLCPPVDQRCVTGVIFFNNTGYLGMCGHGALGVAKTLQYLGMAPESEVLIETPVGVIKITFDYAEGATIENVPSYLFKADVCLNVKGLGEISGDVAWGGNWFFLTEHAPVALVLANCQQLTEAAIQIKKALMEAGVTGIDGAVIDHIEFFSGAESESADSRNFVLCPGGAYDRSPCGTGTSAKMACLAAKNQLQPGETWVQESIIGSRFYGSYQWGEKGQVIPSITGRAYISAESSLVFESDDPFRHGIFSV
ncbi:proline racemase family protein [Marinicella rhabdoformis]|uniref:proline racemase family protein n=1 Tax=Marinicella rhabdoformis TaxID=2580566 RepID=UPI0012AEC72D|nr:proline racemase family protein [Marinicella rhabdoformis]